MGSLEILLCILAMLLVLPLAIMEKLKEDTKVFVLILIYNIYILYVI